MNPKYGVLFALCLVLFLGTGGTALAQPACSSGFCNPSMDCEIKCCYNCSYGNINLITCLQYNGTCNQDPDADGVLWASDNCPRTYNPNQANCDGDAMGDVCDAENGIYARVSGVRCFIDKDVHIPPNVYYDLEDWWDGTYVDQSACNSPQQIRTYKNNEAHCFNVSPYDCCRQLIVNDPAWCSDIDNDHCQG